MYPKHLPGFKKVLGVEMYTRRQTQLNCTASPYLLPSKASTMEEQGGAGAGGGREIKVNSWLGWREAERVGWRGGCD